MGTDTLEVNLIHQVAALRSAVLYAIFLELHKSCDALDGSRCLGILEEYGVGPRALRLLRKLIACHMATGKRRWYIVGCYLVMGDGTTI